MSEDYDWTGFYEALCEHGPHLLQGIDGYDLDADGIREVIVMLAGSEDIFWSDGLQDLLAQGAGDGDLRAGVLWALGLWRENVLTALADNFGIRLDWQRVVVATDSPLVDRLVAAATPRAR